MWKRLWLAPLGYVSFGTPRNNDGPRKAGHKNSEKGLGKGRVEDESVKWPFVGEREHCRSPQNKQVPGIN